MMESAVLYIRVSTQEQADTGVSLDAQEERLRSYCSMRGLDVALVIRDEGISAFKHLHTRPGGAELLEAVATGRARHVVALKLDRLFRNAADALVLTESWNHAGVALHLVDLGGSTLDTTSPTGRMFLTLMAAFAEFERGLASERTVQALAYLKRHGRVYGSTPYGFRRVADELVADEVELSYVAAAREWSAGGLSLRKIADRLTAAGATTKLGGRWQAQTVSNLLSNDIYEGVAS